MATDDGVHGVMGGGDKGVEGERGHRDLGPGESRVVVPSDDTALLGLMDCAGSEFCRDAVRTSCFKAVTGLVEKLNLLAGGEAGVLGVDRPGDASGGITLGSW